MHLIRRPSWYLPERDATPESVFLNRRSLIKGAGALALGAAFAPSGPAAAAPAGAPWSPAAPANPAFLDAGRAITPEKINSNYNNFFEFGSSKDIAARAQELVSDPWSIRIDGACAKPQKIGFEDLIKKMPIEERVYRHRCVEAWSMVVPWTGFPLAELVKMAEPTSDAKFVRFETLADKDTMPGLRQRWYPWPYTEGVTIEEAMNPLSLMVVGAYGKTLHKQFGAPIRLHLPWKFGFKSLKSITRISFVSDRPTGFWEELQASEYGFWANVNPEVPHARWTQAEERVLGEDRLIPTQLYNGYGEEVAGLYKDKLALGRALWM
jgi:sulfoxide reductase catalytic subunit YedY